MNTYYLSKGLYKDISHIYTTPPTGTFTTHLGGKPTITVDCKVGVKTQYSVLEFLNFLRLIL